MTDTHDDFEELLFLCRGYQKSLKDFRKSLDPLKSHPSLAFIKDETDRLARLFTDLEQDITRICRRSKRAGDIQKMTDQKWQYMTLLRSYIPLIGALITSLDWQSPSFTHSLHSQAGIQEGKIIANLNDYKRDQHLNERDYQERFMKEYVDGFKFPAGAYLTSSGMAALTTIITYLSAPGRIKGPVMIGESIYFENAELIETFFKDQKIIKVDEMDTKKVLATYDKMRPDLILFDSLCNSPSIAVPDVLTILKHVSENAKNNTFFVIDNSTLSVALQPLKTMSLKTKIKLLVFESLNKYHQFGLDRVTAGIVWYRGSGFEDLYYARDHAGTNIPDSSVYALPIPNRNLLQKRLLRHNRNAHLLAQTLQEYIKTTSPQKVADIIYPGLPNHPSYSWSSKYSFQGSYFVISFKKPYQKISVYQRFVGEVIKNAKKKKVSINGGTSFGFNTTRVYLTAKNTDFGMPFIRVSVGTENISDLRKLQDVFETVIKSY